MVHRLKCWDEFMMDIANGKKSFDVRKNDRNFNIEDILLLEGYDKESSQYTNKTIEAEVTYILNGGLFGIDKDYLVMGIKVINYNF